MYIVEAQLSLCTDVDQSLCTPTDPDLHCLVVTALLSPSKKQVPSESSHSIDLIHPHTFLTRNIVMSVKIVSSYIQKIMLAS